MGLFALIAAVVCGLVLLETAVFFLHLSHLHSLSGTGAPEPESWPRVSVVMAARDECRDVAEAVSSRLADDYPDLEVILVDDRSSDGTGEIALQAAGGDPGFSLVRVEELPGGWLGKVHAMQRGTDRAKGEWLLFSDADVSVVPGTVRRAVAHCLHEELDMLALVPAYETGSFLVDSVWAVFMRALMVFADPRAIRDPRAKTAIGSGAFNLIRREAYERTPGLEHLRLETGDDVALGVMVKKAGGRLELMDGRGFASVVIYRDVAEFVRGIEKNGSTTAAVPFAVVLGGLVLLFALVSVPVLAIAFGPAWLRALGALALVAYTAGDVVALWTNTRRWAPALLWPIGAAILAYGMLRSTWLARSNGGVYWRDTFYSLDELAEGRRFSL